MPATRRVTTKEMRSTKLVMALGDPVTIR